MRRHIALLVAALVVVSGVNLALADPPVLLRPPQPIERPSDISVAPKADDLEGNDPSVATDDLARLKAELARQKLEQQKLHQEHQKLESEAQDLQGKSIGLAAKVQERELAVSLSEDNLDVLNQRETQILARLKLGRSRLTDILAALELLERQRPPALAVRPEDAANAVRSAILLSDIVPRLNAQAAELAKELKDLRLIRERAAVEHKTLATAATELKGNQTQLETIVSERMARRERLGEANIEQTQRLAELGRRAESLSALVEGLKQAQLTPPKEPAETQVAALARLPDPRGGTSHDGLWSSAGSAPMTFAEAKGNVRLPAVGKVVEKFGVPNGSGGLTKGIKIGTRSGAQVVAPFDGRVKYAGPLKTYGNVLIVEAGGDYLIILAGMTHVDATVGQWLLAGEPVGRMADAGEDGPSELYLEFRRARDPFDPLPWLAGVTKEG